MRDHRGLRILSTSECLLRLGRGGVGRVAVTVKALPAIFPVNYAVIDGDIVFRSDEGSKLAAATSHAVVAFEIDESDAITHTGWSVMVVGQARKVTEQEEIDRLARLPLAPWAASGGDSFVRIESSILSGRELTHERAEADPPLAEIGAAAS